MILHGDCLEQMRAMEDNSVDSVVSDPPYGISFMGKKWDYDVPKVEVWEEALRVLKAGGHILVACGTRTQHRMCVNIEDAGFEIRDIVAWVYGSGFPKSHNIGKGIDKKIRGDLVREKIIYFRGKRRLTIKQLAEKIDIPDANKSLWDWEKDGHNPSEKSWRKIKEVLEVSNKEEKEFEREIIGKGSAGFLEKNNVFELDNKEYGNFNLTKGTSKYEGWGTALKPAMELWTLARKPLSEKTVAENVLKWGTGGINIDECRVESGERDARENNISWGINRVGQENNIRGNKAVGTTTQGRFPANLIHDGSDEVVSGFPDTKSGSSGKGSSTKVGGMFGSGNPVTSEFRPADLGSASRFFYCAKASKSERNAGLEGFEERKQDLSRKEGNPGGDNPRNRGVNKRANHHPTVKPIKLMQYLVRLITPKGGTVLDPYMGSGTTGIACKKEGFEFIGIELDEDYFKIANARIEKLEHQHELF